MGCIRREIDLAADADAVWDALRDVGAVHRRLAEGFVTDTRIEGDARVVTFANGLVVRELLVDVDDAARRVAYAVVDGRFAHHHASMQVHPTRPGHSRLVWITDVFPHEHADALAAMITHGAEAMRRTLERAGREAA